MTYSDVQNNPQKKECVMNIYLHVPEYLALKTKTIQTKGIIVACVEVRNVANSVQ